MKYEVDLDILRKETSEVKHLRDKADLILTLIMMLFPTIGDEKEIDK